MRKPFDENFTKDEVIEILKEATEEATTEVFSEYEKDKMIKPDERNKFIEKVTPQEFFERISKPLGKEELKSYLGKERIEKMEKAKNEKEEKTVDKEKALRYNEGKIELTQCCEELVAAVSVVFMKNSQKYSGKYPDANWKKGAPYMELINCLERHLALFKTGTDIDEESQVPHLFLMAANLQMLIFTMINHPEFDDRDKRYPIDFSKFTKYLKRG